MTQETKFAKLDPLWHKTPWTVIQHKISEVSIAHMVISLNTSDIKRKSQNDEYLYYESDKTEPSALRHNTQPFYSSEIQGRPDEWPG